MPGTDNARADNTFDIPGHLIKAQEMGDGYTVCFEQHSEAGDLAPMMVGLPDDACQCDHWGYVFKGSITFTYVDGSTETFTAGMAYHVSPGHRPTVEAGTELVEFSQTDKLNETVGVVMQNMEQVGQSV